MCDTQVIIKDNITWFAKNSDREPGEPQLVVRLPATQKNREKKLKTTYIKIDQVQKKHAVILSKPSWIWGAGNSWKTLGFKKNQNFLGNFKLHDHRRRF